MRVKSLIAAAILSPLFILPARAIEDNYDAPSTPNALALEAVQKISAQLDTLRLTEKDFRLSPGWELPLTVKSVENFFEKPLEIPVTASKWADGVENAHSLSDLLNVAMSILDGPREAPLKNRRSQLAINFEKTAIPASLHAPLTVLLQSIAAAKPYLDKSVDSLSPDARRDFLRLNDWPDSNTGAVSQEISARRTKQSFESLKSFSEQDLYAAAQIIFKAIDDALPLFPRQSSFKQRIRWKSPQGTVLIGGYGDDEYDAEDLKDAVIVIDMGGRNTYSAPVATAHEKEFRLVIDYGSDIRVKTPNELHGNAGTGVFGIGVMVCPNEGGRKSFETGSFSQGLGMGGVGALVVEGPASFTAERSVQGMGISGVGILWTRHSRASTYTAIRSGQGSALTRGVGIFSHAGDDADIKGGLVQPDPREPLGSVSMCQGVGFGPRAYAGGGVGVAVVMGDSVTVRGSYFSQGVGYWHGMGVFRLRGNHGSLQARRYDMGSGVHYAFGHFDALGDGNHIMNWGVGPAYGWDHAIGSALIQGNDNEMQTEWGSGTASIGSLSFSYIRGLRNKMKLCDHGTNNFVRDEPAYSIQIIDGLNNQLQCQGAAETPGEPARRLRSPWSLVRVGGTALVDNLGLQPPVWPELPREEAVQRDFVDLQARLKENEKKPPLDEVNDLIDVAAAFGMDKATPRAALHALILLPPEKVKYVVEALDPAAVDQLIQLSVALPAHGDDAAQAILNALNNASLQKKMTLINFLRMSRPSTVAPALSSLAAKTKVPEIRVGALRTLAALLNNDTGTEPGPHALLNALSRTLKSAGDKKAFLEAKALLTRMRFGESIGLLASVCDFTPTLRDDFFANAPEDVTAALEDKGATSFLRIIAGTRKDSRRIVDLQLKALEQAEPETRKQLIELFTSTRAASVNAAVIGMGQIGNPADAGAVAPLIHHDNARVRESAAVALGRMGKTGLPFLSALQSADDARTRSLALVGATQSVTPKAAALIERGLQDKDPLVRLVAISALDTLPDCLKTERPKLVKKAKKDLASEEDPEVKMALALLK